MDRYHAVSETRSDGVSSLSFDQVRSYDSLEAALTDDGLYSAGRPCAAAARVVAGRVTQLHVPPSCHRCDLPASVYAEGFLPFCPTCVPAAPGWELLPLGELSRRHGVPVSPVDPDVWAPIRVRLARERFEERLARLAPHLEALADPVLRPLWLEFHGHDDYLAIRLLSVMIATGSVLDVHRVAAVDLARLHREELVSVARFVGATPLLRDAAPFETMLDLSEG